MKPRRSWPAAYCATTGALAAIVAIATAPLADTAYANGRAPAPISVGAPEKSPSTLFLGATFGLVLTDDDGDAWWWFCEQAIGYAGIFDPVYAIGDNIWSTTPIGLARSTDAGCTFETPAIALDGDQPTDIVVDGEQVWVTSWSQTGGAALHHSTDGGESWEIVVERELRFHGVRIASVDDQRIYVGATNVEPEEAWLLRSENGGSTFDDFAVDVTDVTTFRPMGVGDDIDIVFAFADHTSGTALLRSDDAGASFATIRESVGQLTGFARDGANVWASSIADGLYVSSNDGVAFTRLKVPRASGLAFRSPYLYATGVTADEFTIGRSDDQGQSFEAVLRLDEIDGPKKCPQGTAETEVCAPLWPALAFQLGISAGYPDASTDADGAADAGESSDHQSGCSCALGAR